MESKKKYEIEITQAFDRIVSTNMTEQWIAKKHIIVSPPSTLGVKTERTVSVRSGQKRIRIVFGADFSRIVRIQICLWIRIRIWYCSFRWTRIRRQISGDYDAWISK